MSKVSVIICTYNPDPDIFSRCLDSLHEACKLQAPLEVLIVDNNSSTPLSESDRVKQFIVQHPYCRVVLEKQQGLTPARLCAIKESKGDLLVFIDDDNFVRHDFLQNAGKVADTYPQIGSFSGQVELIPATTPPEWTKRYWGMLVHRIFKGNYWSNLLFNNETMPCGAGLCIRKEVAQHYYSLHNNGKRSIQLDRSKDSLLSGGDNDLAMCAIDIGMGMGLFEDLYLQHFIPSNRFTLSYLSKLAYGIYYSYAILKYYRTGEIEKHSSKRRVISTIRSLGMGREEQVIDKALRKGLSDASKFLLSLKK